MPMSPTARVIARPMRRCLLSAQRTFLEPSELPKPGHQIRLGHTVRVICKQDLPHGKAYSGDVVSVKAGYARNFLVPQKMVVYATRQNFAQLGVKDPLLETSEEKNARVENPSVASDVDLKEADRLLIYLRNKQLKIRRKLDETDPKQIALLPGMVDSLTLRSKLSKQLKITLERHEDIHICPNPVPHDTDIAEIEKILDNIQTDEKCKVQIKQLGEFVAKISLRGNYTVPLKFEIVKR